MSNPDEQRTSFIPPNFIEKGKILNGTFDIRNAIEAIIFALLIGVPVVHLPFSLTTRIIILCMTALPAAMVSLIGIGGESITAFLMNAPAGSVRLPFPHSFWENETEKETGAKGS